VWDYVKKNGLRTSRTSDDQRRRQASRRLRRQDQVSMFEMTALVNKHLK
jgi:hypothetical protein